MQSPHDTDAIRQRMKGLRSLIDEDVQDIVDGARDVSDWRSYASAQPWLFLGAALTLGYLIVPRRSRLSQSTAETLAELAKQGHLLGQAALPPKSSVRGVLLTLVGNLFMKGMAAFAGQQASRLFASQDDSSQQDVET